MGKYFTLILLLVLGSKYSLAQQKYIDHTIKKGESVYMISRRYGVSVNAIFELNPGSEDIIYAGHILRVPNSSNTTATSNNTIINDTTVSNYIVKRGETKSGLSRRFGVSIAMLEQQNPHIVSMLQAGHIINLDKTIQENQPIAKEGEHYVVKGETLWGISRKYGISLAQLEAANANQLSEFLQIGQTLIIPDKNSETTIEGEYLVQRGDTKYQLAKRFNMTIAELEEKNPHIVDMLMAGHRLNVNRDPNSAVVNVTEEIPNPQETPDTQEVPVTVTETDTTSTVNSYKNYVIEPKETLFGLAKKAGMSIDELTTLNPKLLTSVNAGDIIKMPINVSGTTINTTGTTDVNDITDTVDSTDSVPEDTTTKISKNKNEALFANLVTETSTGLYFYTPFSSQELSSPEERQNMISVNADFQKYIDFFQGAQIAIDSAKALNLDFDVTLIKKNIAKSKITIESPHSKNAILVPFSETGSNFPSIESETPISIIDIESNIVSNDSVYVYKSIPSEDIQITKTLNYLALQNANIIVISDLDEARNKDVILSTLPESKFLKVDNAGFLKSNALDNALMPNKLNYIVFDSKKTIVLLNTTTALMGKLSNHNIQLVMLESSLLPKQSEVSEMRFRILQLIYPSLTDPQNVNDITAFENTYEDIFSVKPSLHAALGFDVTFDTLLRISQSASFEESINTTSSEQPHLKFEYQKTSGRNYFNHGVYLMQYNSDEGIMELKY
ncbi:LysM peptidoglycan-binding domain-containing protein [Winogradskyella psychrotolerans]|uniref:LysM peptidoglycan-binding domain-containing protein n=1 Tax=Winogradskyella psychrotolerans TaxID=1344585 RepID=UPI001C068AC9|nr:LysM peptidoglycan-binding domain-containing protein [Winogradskyella psychrotolerans]MBU2927126.1 LysM peptidoglycan-binding domain-containing protein [Winogradskyella psychrotolerans]